MNMTAILTEELPSILVSFAYRKAWARVRHLPWWREVVFDSGAFTAHKSGEPVDLGEFAEWVEEERARDPRASEVFSLDVIGDWRASLKNTEELWKRGVEAIPVFHVGEPTTLLKALARDYPKVALGGAVGYRQKIEWAAICFREVWPKRLHGLGFGHTAARKLPFHTIDASSWFFAAAGFGQYQSMGYLKGARNQKKNWLRSEVEYQLKEEARARAFWAGRLPADFGAAPSIRLATTATEKEMRALSPRRMGADEPLPGWG